MLSSPLAMWLAIFIFPPLGLILVWIRRGRGVFFKLAATVAVLAIALAELVFVYGFRVVWNGNMDHVIAYSFRWSKRNDVAVEESRAKQRQEPEPPPAEAAPVAVKEPAPVPKIVPVSYWTDFRGP